MSVKTKPRRYTYECSNGHAISSPEEVTKCLAYVHGVRCRGALKKAPWVHYYIKRPLSPAKNATAAKPAPDQGKRATSPRARRRRAGLSPELARIAQESAQAKAKRRG